MDIRKLLLATAVGFGLQGCLVTPDYQAVASTNQYGQSEAHFSKVVSQKNSIVSVEVDSFIDSKFDYPSVYVGVHNNHDETQLITLGNITVEADGRVLTLKDPEALKEERQNRISRLERLLKGSGNSDRESRQRNTRGTDGSSNNYERYVANQLMDSEIEPNTSYGGYIAFDRLERDVENYKVTVRFNDEEHIFVIKRS
ncbi:hypothetical protein EYS14_00425 [Alteromonadaceae bacterium M269]|nr:hypothetical protein EYS14_00425 [Alteromonadaceae bacterium M269]